jgi:sugar/nucleoside kinase (ribokinase family)
MIRRWDVLGLGAIAVDDLVYVDGYPEPDTKSQIMDRRREGGGLVGTALVTVTRLGGSAACLGVLGDDELSRYTIAEFERDGVDCSRIVRRDRARPIHSVIIVDRLTGQRTLLYDVDGVIDPECADVTSSDVGACRVLLVDSTMPVVARHAIELAHRSGVPVVADLEDADAAGVLELIPEIDHLIVGLSFGAKVTGERLPAEIVRALWRPGHAACVVTAGAEGCWYVARGSHQRVVHHRAPSVVAVDTNGCGDVFHGAYAASLARGCDVADAIAVATIAASIKATAPGGRGGIPDRDTVERHLQDAVLDMPADTGTGTA